MNKMKQKRYLEDESGNIQSAVIKLAIPLTNWAALGHDCEAEVV